MSTHNWQPTDACRTAARTKAIELLQCAFGDKAKIIEGNRPAFVVLGHSIVLASTLRLVGDSATSCPHCSSIHTAFKTDPIPSDFDGLVPNSLIPESLFVSCEIQIPMSMLDVKHRKGASIDVVKQRTRDHLIKRHGQAYVDRLDKAEPSPAARRSAKPAIPDVDSIAAMLKR